MPFVALLKSVDAVVCAGGTMLREAAYLGIPAYSIFQSRMGGVDLRLEQLGRAVLLRDEPISSGYGRCAGGRWTRSRAIRGCSTSWSG